MDDFDHNLNDAWSSHFRFSCSTETNVARINHGRVRHSRDNHDYAFGEFWTSLQNLGVLVVLGSGLVNPFEAHRVTTEYSAPRSNHVRKGIGSR